MMNFFKAAAQKHHKRLFFALNKTRNSIFDRTISLQKQPVFIVACGHSGTTLMLNLFNRHPAFYTVPFESRTFREDVDFSKIKTFFSEQEKAAQGKRIVEKTPRHVRHIKRILSIFPDAQIIAMIRDGRDVASSMLRRDIPIERGIQRWISDCDQIAAWEQDPRVFLLKYEDLTSNQEETLTKMFEFLGEDPALEAVLSTEENIAWQFSPSLDFENMPDTEADIRKKHNKRRNDQISKPIYHDAEKWKKELSEEQQNYLNETAESSLKKWGYL